jgi:hypothetical protein
VKVGGEGGGIDGRWMMDVFYDWDDRYMLRARH